MENNRHSVQTLNLKLTKLDLCCDISFLQDSESFKYSRAPVSADSVSTVYCGLKKFEN
jgi:hypothetical protein